MDRKEGIQWNRSEEKMPSFWQFLLESLPPASREKLQMLLRGRHNIVDIIYGHNQQKSVYSAKVLDNRKNLYYIVCTIIM